MLTPAPAWQDIMPVKVAHLGSHALGSNGQVAPAWRPQSASNHTIAHYPRR